jgi:hypothetical protein
MRGTTVADHPRLEASELTTAERKLMGALSANYPMAGLSSITNARWPETQARIRELEGLADPGRKLR